MGKDTTKTLEGRKALTETDHIGRTETKTNKTETDDNSQRGQTHPKAIPHRGKGIHHLSLANQTFPGPGTPREHKTKDTRTTQKRER